MKPSPYPILDDRPIDQWKVTELKEELKRRKLPLKGLKDDLVRRLDEALRAEIESVSGRIEDADNFQHPLSQVQIESGKTPTANTTSANEPEQINVEAAKDRESDVHSKSFGQVDVVDGNDDAGSTGDEVLEAAHASLLVANDQSVTEARTMATFNTTDAIEAEQVDFGTSIDRETDTDVDSKTSGQVDVDGSVNDAARSTGEKGQEAVHTSSLLAQDELVVENISTDVINFSEFKSSLILDVPTSESDHCEKGQEAVDTSPLLANDELVIRKHSADIVNQSESMPSSSILDVQASENDRTGKLNLNSSSQMDSEDIEQRNEDVKHHLSDMNNQLSEVSPSFRLPENNNSISTDSMSINEKIDALKDNVIADDVNLEPDVKPEMVEPSSSQVVSGGGESHPMDVEAPHENKVSVEVSDNNVTNVVVSRKNCNADLGSPEKLNLDRSSGDDSMEEDTLESKQVSICNSDEVEERSEKKEMPTRKEDNLVDVVCDDVCMGKNDYVLAKTKVEAAAASAEKRKLPDEQTAVFDGPSKRQRRWKNGSAVATELQYSTPSMPTTPREAPQVRSLSGKNSNVNTETPKERVVPPATNSPTDSLRIDNFLRPFTLKAVQELLGKTGTVAHFWMDHIKTHCYVTYSSVEEAIETRNAVYNLQWPPNGGKLLAAEFVDAQEVKCRMVGPQPTQPPVAPVSIGPQSGPAQPSARQQLGLRQKQPQRQQPILPPLPQISSMPPPERERVYVPPPPPLPEKVEAPFMTLDDLFRKTKASPRIYYLPLSEEQVKLKLEALSRN